MCTQAGRGLKQYNGMHPINLDETFGCGVAVYTHESLEKLVIQIKPYLKFEEASLVEILQEELQSRLFGR